VRLLRLPEAVPVRGLFGQRFADGFWLLPLPGAGRYRVALDLIGTRETEPATGAVDVAVDDTPGPHDVVVSPTVLPSGTLRVRVARPPEGGGADVDLVGLDRRATILFGVGDEARVLHVPAGPVTAYVRFRGDEIASHFVRGELAADEELLLEAPAEPGGILVLLGSGPGLADDREARVIAWRAGDSPYGDASGEVVLAREGNSTRWRAGEALLPGTYRATIRTFAGGDLPAEDVTFEIQQGEASTVAFRVEGRR
jgi:hypothetical protein